MAEVTSATVPLSDTTKGTANGDKSNKSLSKNAKRRQKKKEQRASATHLDTDEIKIDSSVVAQQAPSTLDLNSVAEDDPKLLSQYSEVLQRFNAGPSDGNSDAPKVGDGKGEVIYSDDDVMSENEEEQEANRRLSKRKERRLRRLTVAELKQMVKKPELVDWEDVTATDPQLLIQLKSTRNTIPVPPHWSLKRDYLQNKKGIEKPPFQLPSYIAATGIAEMKDALKEKEAEQTLKAKTRERVQPKMGKIVIDYQKLHDAFFRFQTKPDNLTRFGEVYYEGKEFETKFKERKPGELSAELKEALSIPPLAPPPWLIAMQRYGPPPSYPQLRIAGLNAPIPVGAHWGFHPGGWGKPPADEYGNPIYPEAMSEPEQHPVNAIETFSYDEEPEKEPFGQMDPEEDASDDSDESEGESGSEEGADTQMHERSSAQRPPMDGFETPSGIRSVAGTLPGGGLDTPGFAQLRKDARVGGPAAGLPQRQAEDDDGAPKQLYQVLQERVPGSTGKGLMGSEHTYDLTRPSGSTAAQAAFDDNRGTKRKIDAFNGGGVDDSQR